MSATYEMTPTHNMSLVVADCLETAPEKRPSSALECVASTFQTPSSP
jgi:hypothetical protein